METTFYSVHYGFESDMGHQVIKHGDGWLVFTKKQNCFDESQIGCYCRNWLEVENQCNGEFELPQIQTRECGYGNWLCDIYYQGQVFHGSGVNELSAIENAQNKRAAL